MWRVHCVCCTGARAVTQLGLSSEHSTASLAAALADAGRAVASEPRSPFAQHFHGRMLMRTQQLSASAVAFGEAISHGVSGTTSPLTHSERSAFSRLHSVRAVTTLPACTLLTDGM
jgi:hypothetical protein